MQANSQVLDSAFQASFSLSNTAYQEPESLKKWRGKVEERLVHIGFPRQKSEDFQYMNLKPLFATQYTQANVANISKEEISQYVLEECKKSYIVINNGVYRPELSDLSELGATCLVLTTAQAAKSYGTYFTGAFTVLAKEEKDPFVLLNGAYFQEGVFLYIPPSKVINKPIQLLYFADLCQEYMWMMPRVHFTVGANSEASVITTFQVRQSKKYFFNSLVDVTLDENAKLNYIQYDLDAPDTSSWVFESMRVLQKRSSRYTATVLTDASMSRRDWKVALAGEGAEANVQGLWLLHNSNEAHANVIIEHKEPYCHSNQHFKGVLAGDSRSSFQGKIVVQQKAQKTEAYQLNNNLILSDSAQANSKPGLEIYADDVKASHGATCGQLGEEELFYLKSRGVPERDAKHLLIHGFCQEIVQAIPLTSLIMRAQESMHSFLAPDEVSLKSKKK